MWAAQNPQLIAFFSQLNASGVVWAVHGSTVVSLLAGNRQAHDADIIVRPSDLLHVAALLPASAQLVEEPDQYVRCGDGLRLHFPAFGVRGSIGNMAVDVMATGTARSGVHTYHLGLSEQAARRRLVVRAAGTKVYLMHPFDVMALKAVLQRGAANGKYDQADIATLSRFYPDDLYAILRADEIGLDARALRYLQQAIPSRAPLRTQGGIAPVAARLGELSFAAI